MGKQVVESQRASATSGVQRLVALDGLRGLAACGVAFLYHTRSLFQHIHFVGEPRLLYWFHQWGWTLVDLFFLISGYVFAHVYLPDKGESGLTRDRLRDFAVARVARLYPLHLLMLIACALLFTGDPGNTMLAFVANLLMLQAFVQPIGHTFDGPSWSISVEMVCYVLFALGAVGGKRTLRWVTTIAIVGALVHFALQGRPGGPWVGDGLPRGLLGFFMGVTLWRLRDRLAQTSSALLICFLVFGLALNMGNKSSLLPICLFAWPALLLLTLRARFMGSAPMRWLGDRSYAIYLIHYPVLLLVQHAFGLFPANMAMTVAVVMPFTVLVLILSDLSYRFVEQPSRRAIRAAWTRRARAGKPGDARLA